MMKILMRIDDFCAKAVKYIIALLLFAIMAILFIGVIARYFFNSPIYWTDELVTYMLVSMTFFGGYLALRQDRLVRVTFVLSLLPPKACRAVEMVSHLIVVAFLGLLGYYSITILGTPVAQSQKTVALGMPMKYFYTIIPIMIALMLMRMAINIYNELRKPAQPAEETGVDE